MAQGRKSQGCAATRSICPWEFYPKSSEDIAMAKCKILTGAIFLRREWMGCWGLLGLFIVLVNRFLIY